ncbi:MAG TPA: YfhO family protein [Blastocatellia bacterium]|nr:YfhO family protein [Blastocatellia bacterium]
MNGDVGIRATSDRVPLAGSSSPDPHRVLRHVLNIGLIVFAVVALFWRVFFLGETLVDVATLNNQLPWGYNSGASDYPYNRRDLTDMYVTRDYFVVAAYRDGEFPLWNPYTMAGHPIYADGVTRTLSPFLLFYKLFDVPLGYSLARLTELLLACVFMYLFALGIGASPNGALMGSLVFGLSAHSMLHLTGLGWWGGLMWLPLIMLFVDRAIARDSLRQAALAGVFLAAQFFCGYLPNQIYCAGAVVLCYAFFAVVRERGDARKRSVVRAAAMTAVTLGVGFALAATQWVPMLELLKYSNRRIIGAELGYIYLPPWYAGTLLFPNLFGSAYDVRTLTLFTGLGVSHDHILYLGVAALVPLAFALYLLKRRALAAAAHRRVAFFAMLAALSLVIMMAAPLYVPVTRFIPVLQVIRVAVRAGVLFLFAASALVALGTDHLLSASTEALTGFTRSARRVAVVAFVLVAVAIAASLLMKFGGFAVDAGERGKLAFARRAALALSAQFLPPDAGIIIPLVLVASLVLLLSWRSSAGLTSSGLITALVLLLLIDLFWASGQFNRTFDRSRVFPPTQTTDFLRSHPPGRVLVVPSELETNRKPGTGSDSDKIIAPPNTLLPYQISTVSGKNQQFPKWYREYASLIEPQPNMSHVVFDKYRSRLLDLLNVKYVLTHSSAPPLDGCNLLATAEGVSIYESPEALPRAFFASGIIDASSHEKAISVLRAPNFEVGTTAVVENAGRDLAGLRQQSDELHLAFNQPSSGVARIVEDKRNRVVIETDNEREEVLVLSDNYYPGWRAFVDGAPTRMFQANCTMRAVAVPAGGHLVSFVFVPATLRASAYVSFAAAAITLISLVLPFGKQKKPA